MLGVGTTDGMVVCGISGGPNGVRAGAIGRDRGDDGRRRRVGQARHMSRRSERHGRRRRGNWRLLKKSVGEPRDQSGINGGRRMMARVLDGSGSSGRSAERGTGGFGGRHAGASLTSRRPAAEHAPPVLSFVATRVRRACRRIRGICSHRRLRARRARHASARPPSNRARSDRTRSPCG